MLSTKSTKQTKRTFTITFNIDCQSDADKAKALAILFGGFNEFRNDLNSPEEVLTYLDAEKKYGTVDNSVKRIADYFKK